jgi:hypothetical protein
VRKFAASTGRQAEPEEDAAPEKTVVPTKSQKNASEIEHATGGSSALQF